LEIDFGQFFAHLLFTLTGNPEEIHPIVVVPEGPVEAQSGAGNPRQKGLRNLQEVKLL
jgi:hypothetical protein